MFASHVISHVRELHNVKINPRNKVIERSFISLIPLKMAKKASLRKINISEFSKKNAK